MNESVSLPNDRYSLVHYTLTTENARAPSRPDNESNGYDLYAAPTQDFGVVHIPAGERALIDTGVRLALPKNTLGFITPRSGLAAKYGITVLNSPGLVDSGYRGNLKVVLQNNSTEEYQIRTGDRIAQLVIMYQGATSLKELTNDEFDGIEETKRGANGFGSSGK